MSSIKFVSLFNQGSLNEPTSPNCAADLSGSDRDSLIVDPFFRLGDPEEVDLDLFGTRDRAPKNEIPECVHQLFECQVEICPNSIAVEFEGRKLTYAELNLQANQLANRLTRMGIRPGGLVGVYLDRSLEMVGALLGVLKAGCAYVPLDPTYPPERIRFVLEDAELSVLLTQERLADRLEVLESSLILLDADSSAIQQESHKSPSHAVTGEDLAYVIYTSGSTGKPKGVEIQHRAVINLLRSMLKKPGLTSQDRLLAVTTLSFDIAALELFLPLCTGARVMIASHEEVGDGNRLLSRLINSEATVIQATPVTWRLLLDAGWTGIPQIKVLCGGEALSRDLASELLKRADSVWNLYGPTETTIWSAVSRVEPGDGPVPIGAPIENTEFLVLDDQGRRVPTGTIGELYIGGIGLARGYFRRPELTAERFIPNPFHNEASAMLFKTGDLVRPLTDGVSSSMAGSTTKLSYGVSGLNLEKSKKRLLIVRECERPWLFSVRMIRETRDLSPMLQGSNPSRPLWCMSSWPKNCQRTCCLPQLCI